MSIENLDFLKNHTVNCDFFKLIEKIHTALNPPSVSCEAKSHSLHCRWTSVKFVGATCPDKLVLLYICKGISSLILSPCIVFHTVIINKKNTKSLLPEKKILWYGNLFKNYHWPFVWLHFWAKERDLCILNELIPKSIC